MQSLVCISGARVTRYFVDWLGNLKKLESVEIVQPQAPGLAEQIEAFRKGEPVAYADIQPGAA
jgi:hypothetical protein